MHKWKYEGLLNEEWTGALCEGRRAKNRAFFMGMAEGEGMGQMLQRWNQYEG